MSFSYVTAYTIDHTKCGATDSVNFPVGIIDNTGLARLKSTGNGGHVQSTSGFDIRPYADSGLATALTYELVFYEATSGKIEMWVNVPRVSSVADTTIYLAYGNTSLTTDGSSNATWESNYKGVWHLPNGSSLTANDSTSNANNGTITAATASAGQVDGGATFAAANITVGSGASLNITGTALTVEAWVKRTAAGSVGGCFTRGVGGTGGYTMSIGVAPATANQMKLSKFGVVDIAINGVVADTNYHHYAAVWASTGTTFYADGASAGTDADTAAILTASTTGRIGSDDVGSVDLAGSLDEVRVHAVARGVDWILTTYNNAKNPGTFFTVVAEVTSPFISVQPVQTQVAAGLTANFTVTAQGTGTLHYQWKLNGSNVGTDSSTYSIVPTNADNLDTVQCVVSDDLGSLNSNTVYLLVTPDAQLWPYVA